MSCRLNPYVVSCCGSQGQQGPAGQIGPQGVRGVIGAQGFQGPPGGSGLNTTAGDQGPQGVRGFQGNQGNQGFQGPQGNQGPGITPQIIFTETKEIQSYMYYLIPATSTGIFILSALSSTDIETAIAYINNADMTPGNTYYFSFKWAYVYQLAFPDNTPPLPLGNYWRLFSTYTPPRTYNIKIIKLSA